MTRCPTCGGSGEVKSPHPPESGKVRCPTCGGSGEVPDGAEASAEEEHTMDREAEHPAGAPGEEAAGPAAVDASFTVSGMIAGQLVSRVFTGPSSEAVTEAIAWLLSRLPVRAEEG